MNAHALHELLFADGERIYRKVPIAYPGHDGRRTVASMVAYADASMNDPKEISKRHETAKLLASAPELHSLALRIAALNPDAGEIGAGMLNQLVAEARRLTQ